MRRVAGLLAFALIAVPDWGSQAAYGRPIAVAAANQSFNWSGYMQGSLEKNTTFHAVAADWLVPKAKPHVSGEEEYSASWVGIGGGCLDSACTLFDATLIQAGIEHNIDAAGRAIYYAWYELIPGPQLPAELAVRVGDRVHVEIVEAPGTPGIWTITIANRTTGRSFIQVVPYTSTYGSAEWVIETVVVVAETGAVTVGPMPDLSVVHFDGATANGSPAAFVAGERMELVDFDLRVIASPSLPDREADGFNDCTYRKKCPAP